MKQNKVPLSLKIVSSFIFSFIGFQSLAQNEIGNVGIGTTKPNESAILDLQSTNKGFLLPRLTLNQRGTISSPATGLMVYQTDFLSGIYVYDGSKWGVLNGASSVVSANSVAEGTAWGIAGNKGTTKDNFFGTTDSSAIYIRVNNEPSGLIDNRLYNTFLGYRSGRVTKSFNSVIVGAYAMQRASEGNDNVVIGYQSMFSHETGRHNVVVGSTSLATNRFGSQNTVLGAMAGYRSIGSSNVLLGYQAGYFEAGDHKLYIHNNASANPLIYGEFDKGRVGINTSSPKSALTIDSKVINSSGLQFTRLTSASTTKNTNGKVLSVDAEGNVILVPDISSAGSNGNTTTNFMPWGAVNNDIRNSNAGNVVINGSLIASDRLDARKLEVGVGGIMFKSFANSSATQAANGKVLSVDNAGSIILVNDMVGQPAAAGQNYWKLSGNRLDLSQNSKVIIGEGITKISDNFNLYVSKGIMAERVRVSVPNSEKWADYVFNKKYELATLPAIEKYIEANQHLPNIPSAQEMAKNGLDVLEISTKFMEKIEELTLYAIEANKRIEGLEKRLKELEKNK